MWQEYCIFDTRTTSSIRVSGHVKIFFTWLSVYWCQRWIASEQLFGSLALRHGECLSGNSIFNLPRQMRAKIFQHTVCTGVVSLLPNTLLQKLLTSHWDDQDRRESSGKCVF